MFEPNLLRLQENTLSYRRFHQNHFKLFSQNNQTIQHKIIYHQTSYKAPSTLILNN
jgi:hypothetical protein